MWARTDLLMTRILYENACGSRIFRKFFIKASSVDKMLPKKESGELTWGTGLWIARPLTKQEVEFILVVLQKWGYTAHYWLPDPDNELDWQYGARFYFKVMDRSTWESFLEQIEPVIRLEMFTWIETGPTFESGLVRNTTPFTQSIMESFLVFTQQFPSLNP